MTSVLSANPSPGMRAGLHVCGMFASEQERESIVVPFLRRGIDRGDRLVYVADPHRAPEVVDLLRHLVDADRKTATGQVELWDAHDLYLNGGDFDPGHILATLADEMDRALSSGYAGLRLAAEMPAGIAARIGAEELAAYERNVTAALSGGRLAALCQYDRRMAPRALLATCGAAHPFLAQARVPVPAPLAFTVGAQLVRVTGEVDLTTAEHFAVLVAEHLPASGDLHLDCGELTFIDAQGVRALCRTARALNPGHRVVVHRPPAALREALAVLPAHEIVLAEAV
jgi:anti-anti-sigma regulatory factor